MRFLLASGREVWVDQNKTNQCDGGEDAGLTGPHTEETMGETLSVGLHDLLLCLGTLSSSGAGRCRLQLNPSGSRHDRPLLSERQIGSLSISSSQQVSNPFFLPSLQQTPDRPGGHFEINKSSPFLIPAHLLIHHQRCLFQTPCWSSSGQRPISTARGGSPFWVFTMDLLTILHTAGEHH